MKESKTQVACIQKAFAAVEPEVASRIFAAYLEATRSQMWADEATMKAIDAEHGALKDEFIHLKSVIKDLRSIIKNRNKRIDELCAELRDVATDKPN